MIEDDDNVEAAVDELNSLAGQISALEGLPFRDARRLAEQQRPDLSQVIHDWNKAFHATHAAPAGKRFQTRGANGVKSMSSNRSSGNVSALQQWQQLVGEIKQQRGCSNAQASIEANRRRPDLREAAVREANQGR